MTTRRSFLSSGFSALFGSGLGQGTLAAATPAKIKSAAVIAEISRSGERLTGLAVQYRAKIKNVSVAPAAFAVDGQSVARAYANTGANFATGGKDGNFVILELVPTLPLSKPLSVKQLAALATIEGDVLSPSAVIRIAAKIAPVTRMGDGTHRPYFV